jgi:TP53 regulating kinase-like protein
MLIKKGAEADIHLTDWYGRKAVRKVRKPKKYRNKFLDEQIRKKRTLHEAEMISSAKKVGVATPLIYFVDPKNSAIVMQYVKGDLVRDVISKNLRLSRQMGVLTAKLHAKNIVHGDLTTSNFITFDHKLVLIDFGLSYYSDRIEDKAVDIRLIKEIMSSAHSTIFDNAFKLFMEGYESVNGQKFTARIMRKVKEIEGRGRYARVV